MVYDSEKMLTEQEVKDGSPSHVDADYIDIQFQLGPIKEVGVNGCQIPEVIDILVDRLEGFQGGQFRSRENALVITHLQEAQNWLYRRTHDREKRGVEGYNKA